MGAPRWTPDPATADRSRTAAARPTAFRVRWSCRVTKSSSTAEQEAMLVTDNVAKLQRVTEVRIGNWVSPS
jgi:hypothetical protein